MTVEKNHCTCCGPDGDDAGVVGRRRFLKTAGSAAIAAAGLSSMDSVVRAAAGTEAEKKVAEDYVRVLYESLTEEQRSKIAFSYDNPRRLKVNNNWHIVPHKIEELSSDQQELCRLILKGITTEDGFERFQKSMKDDDGGLGSYSCALFGDPAKDEKYQWVLTGRHITLRADGNTTANAAFGGPIFYGHAVSGEEKKDHPGNVWWHQGRIANDLFEALDGEQRKKALLPQSPPDEPRTVALRGAGEISGLVGTDMSKDQKELLSKCLTSLLSMFRETDVKEIMTCLEKNGGIEKARIAYYNDGDIGEDGVWDRWRVEGPAFVWYFRGSPHVHTWVNVAHQAPTSV